MFVFYEIISLVISFVLHMRRAVFQISVSNNFASLSNLYFILFTDIVFHNYSFKRNIYFVYYCFYQ